MHPGERAPVTASRDYPAPDVTGRSLPVDQDSSVAMPCPLPTKSFCGKYLRECGTIGDQLYCSPIERHRPG